MKIGDESLASQKNSTKTMIEISLCVLETWILLARHGIILDDLCQTGCPPEAPARL